jgi:hypothetical protein
MLSLYCIYHRTCLSWKDESSQPYQKWTVTCCSRYGWKWLMSLTSACHNGQTHSALRRYWKKTREVSFSICRLHVRVFSPFRHTNFVKYVRELWIIMYIRFWSEVRMPVCTAHWPCIFTSLLHQVLPISWERSYQVKWMLHSLSFVSSCIMDRLCQWSALSLNGKSPKSRKVFGLI